MNKEMDKSELGSHPSFVYGVVAELAGKERSAIAHYRNEIRRTSYFKAHGALASLLAKRGRLKEAMKHLKESVRRSPNDVWASTGLNDLALLHSRKGRTQEAIQTLGQSIRRNPKNVLPHANGALEFAEIGDKQQARRWLNRALGLRRQASEADDLIGYLLIEHDFGLRRGIRILERFLNRNPEHARAMADLAVGYLKLGNRAKARAIAEKAKRRSPKDAEVDRQVRFVLASASKKLTQRSLGAASPARRLSQRATRPSAR